MLSARKEAGDILEMRERSVRSTGDSQYRDPNYYGFCEIWMQGPCHGRFAPKAEGDSVNHVSAPPFQNLSQGQERGIYTRFLPKIAQEKLSV